MTTNIEKVVTLFNTVADRQVPLATVKSFVDAVVSVRNLDPVTNPNHPDYDPDVTPDNEVRAGLFLAWLKRVLRTHRVEYVAQLKAMESAAEQKAEEQQVDQEIGT